MSENFMIIKTKKLSPREVKKKLRDFIDSISEDCGPEVEKMAEELKAHGDSFVDALCEGGTANYRNDGYSPSYHNNGADYRAGMGRAYHRDSPMYRNEGTWEEREELRKKNEQKLQEIDRMMQELRHSL
ncbi:hypothetical protein L6472_06065 [Prevotella sp. E13-17]|uniref:hypothetical protein n=1 Tax=Prevotella sp. E13-17 TaxID=2913616 RepID=UPI001EDA4D77|nr:hypothetical protein [Prevotella sp. E13-17]UKK52143.1 hypothetical protein L6472_06065 [Prevotella sp. E13-17]